MRDCLFDPEGRKEASGFWQLDSTHNWILFWGGSSFLFRSILADFSFFPIFLSGNLHDQDLFFISLFDFVFVEYLEIAQKKKIAIFTFPPRARKSRGAMGPGSI